MTGDELLFSIWFRCGRVIDDGQEALAENLVTGDDDSDNAEAREMLSKGLAAAKVLRAHIEGSFHLINGLAELKENASCE